MQRQFRKIAWLITLSVIVLSVTIGTLGAHEGRPVGDYRFIVGWLEEPTYEGARNAVSVRVNQVVEGAEHDDSDGHHDPAQSASADEDPMGHHDGEDRDSEDHHDQETGDDEHLTGEKGDGSGSTMSGMSHGDAGHHDSTIEAASAMSVAFTASVDSVSGLNVHIAPEGFTFAPENVNLDHVDGEGHAHIYVDGVKVSRVYTPWYHLDDLTPGMREVEIRLNANDHREYAWNGEVVKASTRISVPGQGGGHQGSATAAAKAPMSVSILVEPDPLGGANLFITDLMGFSFEPEHVSDHHHDGQGYARAYVNGVMAARLYGEALQLGRLAAGTNEVRVTLNTLEHSQYTWNGEPVQATISVDIPEGLGGPGYGDPPTSKLSSSDKTVIDPDNIGSSDSIGSQGVLVEKKTVRSTVPQGAGKPLASLPMQEGGLVPVIGLEASLQVEVSHPATGASRVLALEAVSGDPGHYIAGLVPTAPGVYEFRVFGDVDGTPVDEVFASYGAGGGFDDVQTSAELQFPVVLPEVREIESGVRGAMQTAQQAQDAALAAQGSGGNTLSIVALIVGIVGAVLGAGGIFFGLQARRNR